jgi:phage shock protein C
MTYVSDIDCSVNRDYTVIIACLENFWRKAMTDLSKRLYRSRKNRMIGGVCGGIAEYFGIDPTLVRVLCVLVTVPPGPGLLVYLACWVIIPEQP